jgi:riboflavin biosynthesis pyrimidine reductase
MSGVTSVAAVVTTPAKDKAMRHIKMGLILFILTIPLLLTLWGIIELIMAKPVYNVMLESAAGQQLAYSSLDEELIDRIVAAITDAIVARG